MGSPSHKRSRYAVILIAFILTLSLIYLSGESPFLQGTVEAKITKEAVPLDREHPEVKAVMAVQNRHTARLLGLPDVVGTATGLDETGKPAVVVFTRRSLPTAAVPENLEGARILMHVTGEIVALKRPSADQGKINPAAWFPRPVPIGVSTGHAGECSAGTISARVKDSAGNVYALSNNHVYALENTAPLGSQVLQPGLYDTQCLLDPGNAVGTLYSFVAINFSGGSNTVDAAIASSRTDLLGNATPANGYGIPGSAPVAAVLGADVQKYGRTSSLTRGTIYGINATVQVTYGSGTALFVNQITVRSSKPFIKPGDSGSLLVTRDANSSPVGLLFAGSSSGTFAVANRTQDVLTSFGVVIDGK